MSIYLSKQSQKFNALLLPLSQTHSGPALEWIFITNSDFFLMDRICSWIKFLCFLVTLSESAALNSIWGFQAAELLPKGIFDKKTRRNNISWLWSGGFVQKFGNLKNTGLFSSIFRVFSLHLHFDFRLFCPTAGGEVLVGSLVWGFCWLVGFL